MLVIALGIAVGSALIFGVSMALGAFLAGMVVGRSDYSLRAASEALPMRDAFAVLFFVSVGMLLDPAALLDSPGLVLGALLIVLIGKPLVALLIVWAAPLSVADGARRRNRAGADRRVLVHPRDARPAARCPARRGHQHPGRDVNRVDRAQPGGVSNDQTDRTVGARAPAPVAASQPAGPSPAGD